VIRYVKNHNLGFTIPIQSTVKSISTTPTSLLYWTTDVALSTHLT
jgi:hypothetical protein